MLALKAHKQKGFEVPRKRRCKALKKSSTNNRNNNILKRYILYYANI